MKYNLLSQVLFAILSSFLCFSCNQEELQKQNDAIFIDGVKDQLNENDEMIHAILNAKRPPREFFSDILRLQELRDKAFEQLLLSGFQNAETLLIADYEKELKKEIKTKYPNQYTEKFNQHVKQEFENINYKYSEQNKSQKIAWAYRCLELESEILNFCAAQAGSWCGFTIHEIFSLKDTIQLGEKYEMAIDLLMRPHDEAIYYPEEFAFSVDGHEIKIDYEFEEVEKIGILNVKPPQKGSYIIEIIYAKDTARTGEIFKGSFCYEFKVE